MRVPTHLLPVMACDGGYFLPPLFQLPSQSITPHTMEINAVLSRINTKAFSRCAKLCSRNCSAQSCLIRQFALHIELGFQEVRLQYTCIEIRFTAFKHCIFHKFFAKAVRIWSVSLLLSTITSLGNSCSGVPCEARYYYFTTWTAETEIVHKQAWLSDFGTRQHV